MICRSFGGGFVFPWLAMGSGFGAVRCRVLGRLRMSVEAPVEGSSVEAATAEPVVEPLGEGGLKALKAEREAAAAEKRRADDLAVRLKEFEDREKSEEQKAAERIAAAEARAVEVELRATRAEVAASSQVPVDVLAGPKSGSVEDIQAFADALLAWRGDVQPARLVVPGEGISAGRGDAKVAAFADALGI